MVRRLLNGEIRGVSAAAMILAAASLVSRLVGVLRDRILAGEFGAGESLDIYYAAFRIPDFLFNLLIAGALSAGFIPLFTRLREKDAEDAWGFAQRILHLFLFVFGVLSLVLFVFAPMVTRVIAPGFSPSAHATTASLTRIMLLSPLFLGVSAIVSGVLQSFRRFFITALAPIFYNVGIIAAALFAVPRFGLPALAFGVVLGAFLHFAIQLPTLFHLGFPYAFRLRVDASVRTLLRMMVPRTLTLAVSSLLLIVLTALVSSLGEGGFAAFIFAQNLQSFPLGVIGVSYSVAVFPTFSRHVAAKEHHAFLRSFSSTVRQVLFFCVPATVAFIALRAQIVRGVLGSGAFDWQDTILTFRILAALSWGLCAQALLLVLARAFWAFEDTVRPAVAACIGAFITITFAFFLKGPFHIAGIAYAFSLGQIVQLVIFWLLLRRHCASLDEWRIARSLAAMIVAGLVMAEGIQIMKVIVASFIGTETFVGIALQGGVAFTVGAFLYIGVLFIARSEELSIIVAGVRRRLLRPRVEQLELFES